MALVSFKISLPFRTFATRMMLPGVTNKKRAIRPSSCLCDVAERTGLEPATPGVTGRYSNQLNYRSVVLSDVCHPKALAYRRFSKNALFEHSVFQKPAGGLHVRIADVNWWVLQGSNLRPTACKAVALPTELNTRV